MLLHYVLLPFLIAAFIAPAATVLVDPSRSASSLNRTVARGSACLLFVVVPSSGICCACLEELLVRSASASRTAGIKPQ